MVIRIRFFSYTGCVSLFVSLWMVTVASAAAHAGGADIDPWVAADLRVNVSRARILHRIERPLQDSQPTFVITHGMGGTVTNDRFHQLADAICDAVPGSNVLMVDWSKDSWQTTILGLPSPWGVACNIDPEAEEASQLLEALQIDPVQTTFIGESFGNCVNARIAERMGRHGTILAFNPADSAGGYEAPDLRTCSDVSCSFHTFSMFDTLEPIANAGFFLETPANASDKDQHTAGVAWLVAQVKCGDLTWLRAEHRLAEPEAEYFDATATLSGQLSRTRIPRRRPVPIENHKPQAGQLITAK